MGQQDVGQVIHLNTHSIVALSPTVQAQFKGQGHDIAVGSDKNGLDRSRKRDGPPAIQDFVNWPFSLLSCFSRPFLLKFSSIFQVLLIFLCSLLRNSLHRSVLKVSSIIRMHRKKSFIKLEQNNQLFLVDLGSTCTDTCFFK
jgi:hypothetical protein